MLYLGDKQVTRPQVAAMFKLNLDKLEKYPSFEVYRERKWKDRANGNVVKSGAGMQFRTHFTIENPNNRMKEVFRYVKSKGTKTVGNQLKEVFEPREIRFMGMKNEYKNDKDLAIFLYLHPDNEDSPIRKAAAESGYPITEKPRLSYIDKQKRANDRIEGVNTIGEAMEHVRKLSDEKLILLAKGLGFKNAKASEIESVKADVLEYALKNPKAYLEKSNSTITTFIGKIHNLADMGVFKMNKIGNIRRWIWTTGMNEGGTVVDIVNTTVDAREALINHILSDFNNYSAAIDNINNSLTARQVAENAIKSQEIAPVEDNYLHQEPIGDNLPDHLKNVGNDDALPTTFQEAISYMTKRDGKRPSNQVASEFLKTLQPQ